MPEGQSIHGENWTPFKLCAEGESAPKPRSLSHPEGLGDRMRTAAFAEFQAIRAFKHAAQTFRDVPETLLAAWKKQIPEEELHYELIATRMGALGHSLDSRPVSLRLTESLSSCQSGQDFCEKICSAEHRGRDAALRLISFLKSQPDPDFETIAVFFLHIGRTPHGKHMRNMYIAHAPAMFHHSIH